jgi:phosphoesterase RecJ-like protein
MSADTPDADRIIAALAACRRVLITTHVRPDGDALGTTAALALALRRKSIDSEVLLLSHLPSKYSFIFQENDIAWHDVESGWPASYPLERFDALAVVDTGTWSQLPGLRERLAGWRGPKLVIDHHLTQEDWADCKLVQTQAAAAGEIVAELLQRWNVPIDRPIATALFLAVASDTGWFQFSNTRPHTMRLAATLMEAGVDTDRMYQMLYQNERPQRLALQTRAQESLELLAEGRLAVMRIAKKDFEQSGANVGDTENLINIPLQIRSVEVSMLAIEPRDGGPVRISLRSKGSVDVAAFAEQFGGGGHARAAGLKLTDTFANAHDRVVAAMVARLQQA